MATKTTIRLLQNTQKAEYMQLMLTNHTNPSSESLELFIKEINSFNKFLWNVRGNKYINKLCDKPILISQTRYHVRTHVDHLTSTAETFNETPNLDVYTLMCDQPAEAGIRNGPSQRQLGDLMSLISAWSVGLNAGHTSETGRRKERKESKSASWTDKK